MGVIIKDDKVVLKSELKTIHFGLSNLFGNNLKH